MGDDASDASDASGIRLAARYGRGCLVRSSAYVPLPAAWCTGRVARVIVRGRFRVRNRVRDRVRARPCTVTVPQLPVRKGGHVILRVVPYISFQDGACLVHHPQPSEAIQRMNRVWSPSTALWTSVSKVWRGEGHKMQGECSKPDRREEKDRGKGLPSTSLSDPGHPVA